MAGRGPRTGDEQQPAAIDRARDEGLVRICDLAGRPRGTGFVADHHGTVITSHEAVDGLARLVLHAPGDRSCVVGADAVTPCPPPIWHSSAPRVSTSTRSPSPCGTGSGPARTSGSPRGLARGAGARHHRRDVHGHRPFPPARRGAGAGDRHGGRGRPAARRRGGRRPGPRRVDRGGDRRRGHRAARGAPDRAVRRTPAHTRRAGTARHAAGPQRRDRARVRRRSQSGRGAGAHGDLGRLRRTGCGAVRYR